ncbi:hypothetical protein OF83DRAFT_1178962 [Amylostereum chailletii]|nr:hypothetical protein OF83DRAFT_1178962 [Amylostereum chailletii]
MSSCAICLDTLKAPTAYPCGHVFCYECVARSVRPLNPLTTASCPTCRATFPIVTLNAALIPAHLRPYFLSPFRRLYLDEPSPRSPERSPSISSPSPFVTTPATTSASSEHQPSPPTSLASSSSSPPSHSPPSTLARLQSENITLRQSCLAWRRRAEAQSAAGLGLTAILRLVKEQVKAEREEMARREAAVRRWVEEVRGAGGVGTEHGDRKIEEQGVKMEAREEEGAVPEAVVTAIPLAPLTLPTPPPLPPLHDHDHDRERELDISPLLPHLAYGGSPRPKRPLDHEDALGGFMPLSKKKRLWVESRPHPVRRSRSRSPLSPSPSPSRSPSPPLSLSLPPLHLPASS